jgi:hypothetical protein
MNQGVSVVRGARYGAVCALILTFASVPAANARQQSVTGDTGKPSSKTSTHSKTASAGATKGTGTAHTSSVKHSRRKKKTVRGQKNIDSDRARSIQEALIREHYLSGEATGTWNQASEDAMRRYQGDHGWQTKEVPDSRALIKLGLGPSKDHLLNPESAMTTVPDGPHTETSVPTSHTAPPVSAPVSPPAGQSPTSSDPPNR